MTTLKLPVTSPRFRETVAACGLGTRPAAGRDVATSLSALARVWGVSFPARAVATAARLIAARQHPTHTLLQSWLAASIPPDTEARLGALAQASVGARLELIARRGRASFDLIQEIAEPLWPDVLAAWTGLADQQRRRLHHLRRTFEVLSDTSELSPRRLAGIAAALDESRRIFVDAYRYPRYVPAVPSLFAALETRWTSGQGPIEDEVVFAATQLLFIGSEAAAQFTGPIVDMLMRRPRERARLRANPAYVATFVDEGEKALACCHRNRLQEKATSAPAFESISRQLARMQTAAVIKALLFPPAAIRLNEPDTVWQTRPEASSRLNHLNLRFDV